MFIFLKDFKIIASFIKHIEMAITYRTSAMYDNNRHLIQELIVYIKELYFHVHELFHSLIVLNLCMRRDSKLFLSSKKLKYCWSDLLTF